MSWLENMKDHDIWAKSSSLTQELFDLLRCFGCYLTPSEALDPSTMLGSLQAWESHMCGAFRKAVDLKLQLEKSSSEYTCRWPVFSDGFFSDTMVSVDRRNPNADKGIVWLCLRPSVVSRHGSSERVAVKANVILA